MRAQTPGPSFGDSLNSLSNELQNLSAINENLIFKLGEACRDSFAPNRDDPSHATNRLCRSVVPFDGWRTKSPDTYYRVIFRLGRVFAQFFSNLTPDQINQALPNLVAVAQRLILSISHLRTHFEFMNTILGLSSKSVDDLLEFVHRILVHLAASTSTNLMIKYPEKWIQVALSPLYIIGNDTAFLFPLSFSS